MIFEIDSLDPNLQKFSIHHSAIAFVMKQPLRPTMALGLQGGIVVDFRAPSFDEMKNGLEEAGFGSFETEAGGTAIFKLSDVKLWRRKELAVYSLMVMPPIGFDVKVTEAQLKEALEGA